MNGNSELELQTGSWLEQELGMGTRNENSEQELGKETQNGSWNRNTEGELRTGTRNGNSEQELGTKTGCGPTVSRKC